MQISDRILLLTQLGETIKSRPQSLQYAMARAKTENGWFSPQDINYALDAATEHYLNANELQQWVDDYPDLPNHKTPKVVALILAGNIPLVGLHDLLCVFMSGNIAQIKLSSKDTVLMKWVIDTLCELSPDFTNYVQIVDVLKGFDAVIATGSDNSGRYFDYYFAKYPHIIRRNRSSVAVLTGNETYTEILQLGNDIFRYFGLGCRNVSQVLVPTNYDFPKLLLQLEYFADAMQHHKFKNNYDYNRSIYLLNKQFHYASDFLMLIDSPQVSSPIAVLHFQYYANNQQLNNYLSANEQQIQCVIGSNAPYTPFGEAQQPTLWNYADGIDTLQWLVDLGR